MQIRLTVLGPRSGHQIAPARCDVLVTAPVGTPLAAVASGLASTVGGPDTGGTVVLYAGAERLDPQRRILGEPPLVDGAVLALQTPVSEDSAGGVAALHVVAGPDAGGVHLLHPGAIRVGRSADADVPLDDPDVSRLHCVVTVAESGRVAVADLDSTNGTTLDGAEVGPAPVPLTPGALLRVGESTLRLAAPDPDPALAPTPDLEGHLMLPARPAADGADTEPTAPGDPDPTHPGPPHGAPTGPGTPTGQGARGPQASRAASAPAAGPGAPTGPGSPDPHAARASWVPSASPAGPASPSGQDSRTPQGAQASGAPYGDARDPHAPPPPAASQAPYASPHPTASQAPYASPIPRAAQNSHAPQSPQAPREPDTPRDPQAGRRRGLGAWARRWVGRDEQAPEAVPAAPSAVVLAVPGEDDAAALLLAALGPTERLWSRGPGHPERLVVGLGAGSRVALRETGALGLAGPRARLGGLARSVVSQLAALHAPAGLEVVLIAADRARPVPERVRDWGWLGWLPHTRPAHGQDCRLLLAYDRDQAAARVAELHRRLEEGALGGSWATAPASAVREAAAGYAGPYTLLVVDGDPGVALGRLASHGPAAGVHVLCLAETPAAGPASPVQETYEAACAAAPVFRDCGTVALLSGDVATAVRTFTTDGGTPVPHGATATADAVSAAWAERFARALAPLRADGCVPRPRPAAAALPAASRLLDELGLARATPASLMARWAAATEQGQAVGGLAEIVLGGGRGGPVGAELVTDGPHLLIEGPAGSGRTELLRSVAAALAAAARPDRMGLVLLDGAGGERGEGLGPCTELPHVSAHLVASDPVRMREFAQALGAELKRRAELLEAEGGLSFTEWHARREAAGREIAGRVVAPRRPGPGELLGEVESARTGTLRLRAGTPRTEQHAGGGPLPRLVVLVDDYDALVAPGLGSTGRPAAGSVVRALEAVAREGARLGVHLVATSARPERTAETELARVATLRVELAAPDQPGPGRGVLRHPDGRTAPFQAGRVTGRIPRTATQRPTVVPVEWDRMGDPPARRPVRELGNGPTDLALLASALDRASHLVSAIPVLFPPAP
ncbi:FHA domain-containing protein [Streptomyces sp. NPDC090022]|uniref:FHA domain-containing protein n=1 Tax=Streptomyces sp. NPDC090022 TaxID=3365920 RepID=UPI00380D86C5